MRHPERGAILIYTAVSLLLLVGVTTVVVDYGVLMLGRHQAQNSADAGALAGAIGLAFDDYVDRSDTGAAKVSAHTVALTNGVVGESPAVEIATDIYFYPDNPAAFPETCDDDSCIRVDVYRNQDRGNPLPMFFGPTLGLTDQGVWATAIAQAADANGTQCLKPWLIPDKFTDVDGDGVFSEGDIYENPGWTEADIGTTLTLSPGNPQDAIAPSDFFQIAETGQNYAEAINSCVLAHAISDLVEVFPGAGFGITRREVEALLAAHGGELTVTIGMFDPEAFSELDRQSGKYDLQIVNMMGFRLDNNSLQGNTLVGTIIGAPGEIMPGPFPSESANFLKKIQLIR